MYGKNFAPAVRGICGSVVEQNFYKHQKQGRVIVGVTSYLRVMSLCTIKRTQAGIVKSVMNLSHGRHVRTYFQSFLRPFSGIRTRNIQPPLVNASVASEFNTIVDDSVKDSQSVSTLSGTVITTNNNGIRTMKRIQPVESLASSADKLIQTVIKTDSVIQHSNQKTERRRSPERAPFSVRNYPDTLKELQGAADKRDLQAFISELNTIIYAKNKPDVAQVARDIFPMVSDPQFVEHFTHLTSKLVFQLPQLGFNCSDPQHKLLYLTLFRKYVDSISATGEPLLSAAVAADISSSSPSLKKKRRRFKSQVNPLHLSGLLQGTTSGNLHKHLMTAEDREACLQMLDSALPLMQGTALASILLSLYRMGELRVAYTFHSFVVSNFFYLQPLCGAT